ncbi:hypothetical protein [Spiroplasma endosymbiont of Agriotes lineatus]|uniref:hypothetical protein n=1 Tax=Spiroplasma endosymbiont of Agriotes lineatus TaxID=3077930 RepID=UPI0030D5BEDC
MNIAIRLIFIIISIMIMLLAYFAYKIYVKIKMRIKYKNAIKNNTGNFTKNEKVFIALPALKNELKLLIQKKIMKIKNNVLRNYYGILKTICPDRKNACTSCLYCRINYYHYFSFHTNFNYVFTNKNDFWAIKNDNKLKRI